MSYLLRPYDAPADDVQFAALSAAANPDPWTVADVAEWRRTFPEGGSELDLVAVDEQSVIIGHGHLHRLPWMTAGQFHVDTLVHPDYRGQGLGNALFAGLEKFAQERGATSRELARRNYADMPGIDPTSPAWAGSRSARPAATAQMRC